MIHKEIETEGTKQDYRVLDAYDVYKVEGGDEQCSVRYFLHGPRARYGLIRNRVNPEYLFAINARKGYFGAANVRGYDWFTDRNGIVEPINTMGRFRLR